MTARPPLTDLRYPPELPITDRRPDLLATLRDHQVVIVAGETGSGKSTQLPKLCLELGRGCDALIGHTQPRRLAARTVAERIAEELGSEVGGAVGYAVRFTDRVGPGTYVKVMTDGILLAELRRDRDLRRYDTVIIDEAHERSLNIDFLLGYLKRLLPRRPDLKVVITSATIDTARFAEHFGGAPVVEVSGRTYPVEIRYRPFGVEPDDDRDQTQAVCDAVRELAREGPGDVLVFLSGEREIHDTADAVRRLGLPATEVLALYARLSAAEQHRIFQPHPGRRVVLATNVAETSLTVPGVRYVVDAGTARISRYSRRLKVQRLPIEPVSQASANQRAGRCGRVAPGICVRLYAEDDFTGRPAFTEPEILRTNLASVILQMASLRLGDVASFPFVEPPDRRSIDDGIALLHELGALDAAKERDEPRLTPLGRTLAQLPVDPRLGRMVVEAGRRGCVREVMILAAALSIQDVRERPADHQQAADEAHRRFAHPDSDFLAVLALWEHLRAQQKALSSSQFRKLCRTEFLHYLRVREWQDLYRQLRTTAAAAGIHAGTEPADPDRIHQALLAGLLSQVGVREGQGQEFTGARNARFLVAPSSALAKKPPRWVMAAELVETNRLWARTVARVQPEWAEELASHLVKRTYSEPRWDARRGAVMADERVTLYGLPLVARRTVQYGRVDPDLARDLFIEHALVGDEWEHHHRFVADNRRLLEEVRSLEDRVRRRDLVVDDEALFAFFDARLPDGIVSTRHFDRWWRDERRRQPALLTFTLDDVVRPEVGRLDLADYPTTWRQGDVELSVTYTFDLDDPCDGVTVHVPLALLNRVEPTGFDWQVPGHRRELLHAVVRSLPKTIRRQVLPAAERADAFLAEADPSQGPLAEVLAAYLSGTTDARVEPGDVDAAKVPDHLRITFAVDDDSGRRIAYSKSLAALRRRLQGRLRDAIADAAPALERTGLTAWTIGELPRVVAVERGGHEVDAYPALVDEGATVGVRLLADAGAQAVAMRAGTLRLLLLTVPTTRRLLQRDGANDVKLALARTACGTVDDLLDDVVVAAIDHLLDVHGGPAWDAEGFERLREAVRTDVMDLAADLAATAGRVLVAAASLWSRVATLTAPSLAPAVADVRQQLAGLVHPGFVAETGAERLPHLVRYLKAVERRLDKAAAETARDRERMAVVRRLADDVERATATLGPLERRRAVPLRWMLEELRVSLFAQQLGTAVPVSEQRIRKELAAIGR
jgi:ATP-dependent helicase HrpA